MAMDSACRVGAWRRSGTYQSTCSRRPVYLRPLSSSQTCATVGEWLTMSPASHKQNSTVSEQQTSARGSLSLGPYHYLTFIYTSSLSLSSRLLIH